MVIVLFSSVGWIFDPQIDQLVSKSMQENMLSNRYGGTIKSLGDKEKIATCIPSKTNGMCKTGSLVSDLQGSADHFYWSDQSMKSVVKSSKRLSVNWVWFVKIFIFL